MIGVAGNEASVTDAKLLAGKPFQVMLYVVGEFVVALYAKVVVCKLVL